MKKLLLFLLPLVAYGQVTYTTSCPGPPGARAGTIVNCNVAVSGTPAATRGTITVNAGATPVNWTFSTAVPNKQVSSAASTKIFVLYPASTCTTLACADAGVANGTMGTISFTMPNSSVQVAITAPDASDGNGGVLTVTTNPPVAVTLLSNCDIDGNGTVNQADISAVVTSILGGSSSTTTLMKVVNASLGGACLL